MHLVFKLVDVLVLVQYRAWNLFWYLSRYKYMSMSKHLFVLLLSKLFSLQNSLE